MPRPGDSSERGATRRFTMIVCPLLLDELAEVLARPKFERWASEDRGPAYVAGFAARSDHQPDPVDVPRSVRDPNDDYLVPLARATGADALVSVDRDLLDASVEDLDICTPAAFLERLAGV
jgi:predicted nucleic acid-binding protein